MKFVIILLFYIDIFAFSVQQMENRSKNFNDLRNDFSVEFIRNDSENDIIEKLSKSKIKIDKTFIYGDNLAHLSIKYRKYKLLSFLIKNHFDISLQNSNGNTPLHIALYNDDYKAINILLKSNYFTNSLDKINYQLLTPVELAKKSKNCYIQQIFNSNINCNESVILQKQNEIKKRNMNYGNKKIYIGN